MSHDTDTNRRVIHASRIESECGWRDHQYAARHWHRPPWVPFLRGSAVHGAREWAIRHYMEAGDLPPVKECQRAAVGVVDARTADDMARGIIYEDEQITEALDEAMPIIEADRRLLLPDTAPQIKAVEETLGVELGGGWVLVGTMDARGVDPMTGTGLLADLKSSAKSPGAAAISHAALSLQLSAYALLHQVHYGSIPMTALQYAWAMKRGPKADTIQRDGLKVCDAEDGSGALVARVIPTTRSARDLDAARKRLRIRIDTEEAGWHTPAQSGFMSPCQRCPHWGHEDPAMRCEFVTEVKPSSLKTTEEEA